MQAPEHSAAAEVTVVNGHGLHARPSHAIVATAAAFAAEVTLHCDGRTADARSILAVMTLGAACGARVRIEAVGTQAAQAVAALERLFACGFEEA